MAWTVAVLITVAAVAVGPLDAKEIEDRQSYNYTDDLLFMNNELNDAHHLFSNKTGQILPRKEGSKCKVKNICIIMGGSCVTNATHCGGRLVPGCKGKNCQCCVAGSLEDKINSLEQNLQNMQVEFHNLRDNLTDNDSNLKMEFHTLRDNLTDANMQLSDEFQSMSDNFNDSLSNIGSKMDSLMRSIEEQNCPVSKGFFIAPNTTNQCMKAFREARITWSAASAKCKSEGLALAKPLRPISLRKYLVEQNDDNLWFWLDAHGDGSTMRWQRNNKPVLSNSDSLWYTNEPANKVTSTYCLQLIIGGSRTKDGPNQPYYSNSCEGDKEFPLCEVVSG